MSKRLVAAFASLLFAAGIPAYAQISDGVVKIGVMSDMSGPYSDHGGEGSVIAAKMAVEDCLGAECRGLKIEVVSADHQNKADIASSKAREWLDQGKVDMLVELTNSAAALAVQKIVREKGGVAIYTAPATTRLTNEDCIPNGLHWMYDSYALASGAARTITQLGGKSWFFVTVDYAFGQALEKDASEIVKKNGGSVVGSVRHPLNAVDMSSFIVQAQASKAQVIGLANGATDTVNAIKEANQFGVVQKGQRLAALLVFLHDVRALGLDTARGMILVDGFYWDFDDQSREWSGRFQKLHSKKFKPTMIQAGVYSGTLHYLKAVASARTDEWKAVTEKMRQLPIQDAVMRNASIRPDGRVIHDIYLYQVKSPTESKGEWDYYKLLATIPAAEAFKPLADSACALVRK